LQLLFLARLCDGGLGRAHGRHRGARRDARPQTLDARRRDDQTRRTRLSSAHLAEPRARVRLAAETDRAEAHAPDRAIASDKTASAAVNGKPRLTTKPVFRFRFSVFS